MYHFFVEQEQIGQKEIVITGEDVNHIRNVLRMKPGKEVLISNGQGINYCCEVTEIAKEKVIAQILSENEEQRELPAKLYLFQGLPKGEKMELIIQKAVELGVYQIIPVSTRRSVVKLEGKKEEAKIRRWNSIAESAAKQSGRGIIPKVTGVMSLKEAFSYASVAHANVIIETIKHAENENGTVVRMYESENAYTKTKLTVNTDFKKAYICNLLEETEHEAVVSDKEIEVVLKPYEVVTVKIV